MEKGIIVKYPPEYQRFVKKITDQYIKMLEGDCPYNTWSGYSMCDDQCIPPTKEQKEKFHKERNIDAIIWLKRNLIPYEQWLKKF